ncbi:unnamed protein product [Lathyrus sativus]|nr:unnamed protein product [Lathyrus sativus]CAK8065635.1 unnamed protein product [Lathyrus sativus]
MYFFFLFRLILFLVWVRFVNQFLPSSSYFRLILFLVWVRFVNQFLPSSSFRLIMFLVWVRFVNQFLPSSSYFRLRSPFKNQFSQVSIIALIFAIKITVQESRLTSAES